MNIDDDPVNENWIRLSERKRRIEAGEDVEPDDFLDGLLAQLEGSQPAVAAAAQPQHVPAAPPVEPPDDGSNPAPIPLPS